MTKLLSLLTLAVLIISCTPQKRLNRLIKHHPELIQNDTILKMDTTVVNGVQHDTVFTTTITRDTIVIKDKQLTIKYYNDGKTTYLKGVCDTVKIIKEVPVVVNKIEATIEEVAPWYDKYIFRPLASIGLIFLLLLLFGLRIKK